MCVEPGKCDKTSSHPAKDGAEVKSFHYRVEVVTVFIVIRYYSGNYLRFNRRHFLFVTVRFLIPRFAVSSSVGQNETRITMHVFKKTI